MYNTKQRNEILTTLSSDKLHPTAEELYRLMSDRGCNISIATVYRKLKQMCEEGEIMRISVPNSPDRYDAVNDGHYHLICDYCGRVVDIEKQSLPNLAQIAKQASNCEICNIKLLFYGICHNCTQQADN